MLIRPDLEDKFPPTLPLGFPDIERAPDTLTLALLGFAYVAAFASLACSCYAAFLFHLT